MNYLAVLVCAVLSIVIGSIWYGPLFGKPFMKATGMDSASPEKVAEMKKKMWIPYLGQLIASLVMILVLAQMINFNNIVSATQGMFFAFFLWLGFVVPVQFGQQLWGGKMVLFWLGAGNMLFTMLAYGAILGAWK